METPAQRLGALIHRKRTDRDPQLTQAGLGDLIGKPQAVISRWEHGRRMPDGDTLAALVRVLGITPEELHEVYTAEAVA